jgi:translation initiation factor 5B
MELRQPIVVVLGHIDHGKTTLLDYIRGTAVALREAGGITQHIGASLFPFETLERICGPVVQKYRGEIRVPGLLVIDTPGHEAFFNLRRRGGSVADIAILVVDVMKGFEVQTHESINILKMRETPFLIAANKVDLIPGWKPQPGISILESLGKQGEEVKRDLEGRIYSMIGALSRLGIKADRFDLVKDFMESVAIVPVSAKTGEGVPELLAVLVGLTQQYMKLALKVTKGLAKGVALEVREDVGLGVTVNAIIYDGVLEKGDLIVIGGKDAPIVTKVRALFMPKPLDEIRDPKDRFTSVDKVTASAGVKIVAPDLENAIAGSSIFVAKDESDAEKLSLEISKEIGKLRLATDKIGLVVKADTLGSLEAILHQLELLGLPIRKADIGHVSKQDVVESSIVKSKDALKGCILAFNVKVLPDAQEEVEKLNVKVFQSDIIYRLLDDYVGWMQEEREARVRREFESLVKPAKIALLRGYVFRRSGPAIVGVKVLRGTIKPKYKLMKEDGEFVGTVMQIQDKGVVIPEAKAGAEVAISMKEPTIGRQVKEGDTLFVMVPDDHARLLSTKYLSLLTEDESEVLREVVSLTKRWKSSWGRR